MQNITVEQYQKMIYRICWSFYYTTGVEWEEMVSESYVAFCEAKNEYDPEGDAQFSTYLYTKVRNRLINYCKYEQGGPTVDMGQDFEDVFGERNPDEIRRDFSDKLFELSEDAKAVCRIVFESPEEFVIPDKPKLSSGKLRKHLRESGWKWTEIWDSFREIRLVLNQN